MLSPFVFVDTSAWYAFVDKSDLKNPKATEFIRALTTPLATSTYVLDETVTLIKAHLGHQAAVRFGQKLRQEEIAKLLRITEQDEQRAWEIFVKYYDKGFSFTDCTSFALMERFQIDVLLPSTNISASTADLLFFPHKPDPLSSATRGATSFRLDGVAL